MAPRPSCSGAPPNHRAPETDAPARRLARRGSSCSSRRPATARARSRGSGRPNRPRAWYRVSPAAADVASVSRGIAARRRRRAPGCNARLEERLRITKSPDAEFATLAEMLVEDLAGWPEDAWLVLDDAQHAARARADVRVRVDAAARLTDQRADVHAPAPAVDHGSRPALRARARDRPQQPRDDARGGGRGHARHRRDAGRRRSRGRLARRRRPRVAHARADADVGHDGRPSRGAVRLSGRGAVPGAAAGHPGQHVPDRRGRRPVAAARRAALPGPRPREDAARRRSTPAGSRPTRTGSSSSTRSSRRSCDRSSTRSRRRTRGEEQAHRRDADRRAALGRGLQRHRAVRDRRGSSCRYCEPPSTTFSRAAAPRRCRSGSRTPSDRSIAGPELDLELSRAALPRGSVPRVRGARAGGSRGVLHRRQLGEPRVRASGSSGACCESRTRGVRATTERAGETASVAADD